VQRLPEGLDEGAIEVRHHNNRHVPTVNSDGREFASFERRPRRPELAASLQDVLRATGPGSQIHDEVQSCSRDFGDKG
jgi:hypothetical protein